MKEQPAVPVVAPHRQAELEVAAPRRSRHRPSLVLGLLLATFLGLELLLPLGSAVKIGADEEFELSKATLCAHGYRLYTEIWNDQPPLTTSILTSLVRHISPRILGPRLLSVGLALVLLASFFVLVARTHGDPVAGLATALLMASPGFIELSSSCMQEIPALAPVIAALCVLISLPSARWHTREVLAGALFGFALQLKLIGVIYLPLAVLILGLEKRPRPGAFKSAVRSSAIVIATAAVVFVGLNWLTGNPLLVQLQQSWAAHFSAPISFEFGSPADRPYDWTVLARHWDTTLPALAGVLALALAMRRTPVLLHVLPLAWLGLTLVVFTTHKPWWSYYYLHNSVPLAWCAAIGFAAIGHRFSKPVTNVLLRPPTVAVGIPRSNAPTLQRLFHWVPHLPAPILFALFSAAALSWMAARVYLQETSIRSYPRLEACLVLKEIERYRPFTPSLFAYDSIYSFHADIPTPPRLAMITLKRLWSGYLTSARLVSEVEAAKPGLILLPNDATAPPFQDLLNREYRLVYQDTASLLYAHRSISRRPFALPQADSPGRTVIRKSTAADSSRPIPSETRMPPTLVSGYSI